MASEAASGREPGSLPALAGVLGVGLALAGALPLTPGGLSFVELAEAIYRDVGPAAIPLLLMLGAPFLFGLVVGLAALAPTVGLLRGLLTALVSLLQADLVYVAIQLLGAGVPQVLPLVGFALVTGGAMALRRADGRAVGDGGPPLRWWVRWGALLIAGFALWWRVLGPEGTCGPAIDLALVCAALLTVSLARRPLPG